MEKKEVLGEFEESFNSLKKDLGFRVSLDELDEEFSLIDSVLEQGYVREKFSMQVASRIVDYFRNWAVYLNSLIIPSPQSYPSQTEAKLFNSEEDKNRIWKIIKVCMNVSSKYSLMFLSKDKKMQGQFIDESYVLWSKEVRPFMVDILDRVNKGWASI